MTFFLAAQHTYDGIQIGLFNGPKLIQTLFCEKKNASKKIVSLVDQLLRDHKVSFDDLLFVAANQGPGPFTSLRVVIASINGIAFATNKSMIGIDGLEALFKEFDIIEPQNKIHPTVALLNAYSGDVYFAIRDNKKAKLNKGYQNISVLLEQLKTKFTNQNILFIGQAIPMHQEEIKKAFGDHAIIPTDLLKHCSIEMVGAMAWKRWEQKDNLTDQILPLYLKTIRVEKKKSYAP